MMKIFHSNPQATALYLHWAYGLLVFDISNLLGVRVEQVRIWIDA